jgi:hypothetical protein
LKYETIALYYVLNIRAQKWFRFDDETVRELDSTLKRYLFDEKKEDGNRF